MGSRVHHKFCSFKIVNSNTVCKTPCKSLYCGSFTKNVFAVCVETSFVQKEFIQHGRMYKGNNVDLHPQKP